MSRAAGRGANAVEAAWGEPGATSYPPPCRRTGRRTLGAKRKAQDGVRFCPARRKTPTPDLRPTLPTRGRVKCRSSPSAPPPSATSPWRLPPIAVAPPTAAPTITIRRCLRGIELIAFGLWLRKSLGIHAIDPCRRARHAGMAARQDRGDERQLLSGNRRRSAAGHLPVHRQQSRRGRAGQAPHRRRHARPSAAAAGAGRPRRGPSRSWNGWSTNMRRPTGSTAAAATGWRS